MMKVVLLILSLSCVLKVRSQENAAPYISKSLIECYNNTDNLIRDNRPPADINTLIAIIRKVEYDGTIQNDRKISTELIHRFKQDGIEKGLLSTSGAFALPYAPTGFQAGKNRALLTHLIPGNAVLFPNNTLTSRERCSLHFMMSNSVDLKYRGDEAEVCNKLNRYQMRTRRNAKDPNNDVETFDTSNISPLRNNLQEGESEVLEIDKNTETINVHAENVNKSNITKDIISSCPLENGAVYTKWGTIQAGTVILGIEAGRETQYYDVNSYDDAGQSVRVKIDSKHATTLAGYLAEAALRQGSRGNPNVVVGCKGDWDSIVMSKSYYLERYMNLEITDSGIRGGLDGIIIASNMAKWKAKARYLSVSQVLDMYYSERGVLSSRQYRACNRRLLFNEVLNSSMLITQVTAFSFFLNEKSTAFGTLLDPGVISYSRKAIDSFKNYIPNMNDLACDNSNARIVRSNADILIVLDSKWDFKVIQSALGYLLSEIDITKFNSNFTIINGIDGGILVNSSDSILPFYEYNKTRHNQNTGVFDVQRSFESLQTILRSKVEDSRITKKVSQQSSIVLFMVFDLISESGQATAENFKNEFRVNFPETKLLVLGQNSKQTHASLVFDVENDAFNLPNTLVTNEIRQSVRPLIARIQQEPRRIINPVCDSSLESSYTFNAYVDPRGVSYHKIAPNYFLSEVTGERSITITNSGYGSFSVCMSRNMLVFNQSTTDSCKILTSASSKQEFPLPTNCDGYDIFSCAPVYIMVQPSEIGEDSINALCQDNKECRFPDDLKYTVTVKNLDCFRSSGNIVIVNVLSVAVIYILTFIL